MSRLTKKYRPQNISEVVGQPHLARQLTDLFEDGRIPGVVACLGPSGHGKTTLARVIAKRVNCLDPDGADSCGECRNCRLFENGALTDVVEYNSATDRGINFVRSLQGKTKFKPRYGGKRVYIFDEAHSITKQAMEAMLKMLEDNPDHTVFILCTTEPQALTTTILQRCKQLHFKTVEPKVIARDLLKPIAKAEQWRIPNSSLLKIAEHGDGIPRVSVSLLGSVGASISKGRKIKSAELETLVEQAISAMGWQPPKRSAVHFARALLAGENAEVFKLIRYERADLVLRAIHDLCTEGVRVQAKAGGRTRMTAGLHNLPAAQLLSLQAITLKHLCSVIGLQGGFSPVNSQILASFVSEALAAVANSGRRKK